MKFTTTEQKKQWKAKISSRFVRVIKAPHWQASIRFPKPIYDEQGRRIICY
jgi:hypothetical protein